MNGRRTFITLLGVLALGLGGGQAGAASSDLFFSEYVEGSSNNKALEIFNDTGAPIDLAAGDYAVEMYFNGNPAAGLTIPLSGVVASGDVFVLAQSAADPAILAQADQTNGSGWFNGDDAVVLRRGSTVVDVIGQIGFDPGSEWGTGLTSTADNTLRRKSSVTAGDPDGSNAFDPALEWDGYATNTFDGLGAHTSGGGGAPVTLSCGALSAVAGVGRSQTVSATDADGIVTSIDVTGVDPVPAAGTIGRTSLTPATTTGGTATATISVSAEVPAGSYAVQITATNGDATPETATCTLNATVLPLRTIGEVQGPVGAADDGTLHRSPFAPPVGTGTGETVAVRGVVTQRTLARTSSGADQNGFFLQNTPATADGDPTTSDGIFVFLGGFTTLIGGYTPTVGDEIVMTGRVSEFFNLTELSSARIEQVLTTTLDVNAVTPPFTADPPDDLADANRYWERREGMRGRVPAASIVLRRAQRVLRARPTARSGWRSRPARLAMRRRPVRAPIVPRPAPARQRPWPALRRRQRRADPAGQPRRSRRRRATTPC